VEEKVEGIRIVRRGSRYSVYSEAKRFYQENKEHFDIVVDEINTKPFNTPAFVSDKPVVALIHQLAREFWFYETRFPINMLGYFFLENYWLKKYRNIPTITVSKSSQEDLVKLGFKDVHVVPEGINFSPLDRLPEKEPSPTFLFVGRLKKAKKPDHALRAFKTIKGEIPNAKLWIIGDGYMRKELESLAGRLFPNSSDIMIFGRQNQAKKLELMSKAHVLLVPGVREGWGLVVTEASAMGTPAVAYDVPGLRDSVIDGVTGNLVHAGDTVAMGIEAVQLMNDHILRKTYARNGLQAAKQFNWDNTSTSILKLLQHSHSTYQKIEREQHVT
jgi:glycosyltransferase involved in cell wall biosynthesis